jgi:hypothetical protein
MARHGAGSPGPAEDRAELVREWVRQSCEVQGLAVKITDPRVLGDVARLLVESPELRE